MNASNHIYNNRIWIMLLVLLWLLMGCSATKARYAWDRTKKASYNAITDPVTWGTALGAAALYATAGDDNLTDYFMENEWIDNDLDEVLLTTNAVVACLTAVTVPREKTRTKAKRLTAALAAFGTSKVTADILEENVSKEAPDGSDDALGSHHAIEPFAGAAVTRRNVAAMKLSPWAEYGIVGVGYATASLAALTRVQEGGHSFGDQLVNAALGNFFGIFFSDAFMLEESAVEISIVEDHFYLGFRMAF